jgi:hypothetical protein
MATNGKTSKNVVARDEHGRWLKGFSGGPGRPPGSRNKLNEDFLHDLHEDWEQHGKKIFQIVREKYPEIYFQGMVKLAVVHRVELGQPKAFDKPRTVEEALDQLEEQVGPRGRREFEKFLRKMERLEAEENGEVVDDEDTADLPVLSIKR